MPTTSPYPLIFEPIFKDKVWGGRRLERFGKKLPAGQAIGESWELADLASTSASGAGGGAAHSTIANGPLAGKTIRDALAMWGEQLTGPRSIKLTAFPLLVKFLDAREHLSVQVHPSPAYAKAHKDANLKTECWYILDAEPGSVIYKGVKPDVTRETFSKHIADGTIVNDMIAIPAVPGEMHNLPSGTCHALGAGVLVAEVQTPSDTTYRVYDWGRAGRELHIQQALECIDFHEAPPATRLAAGQTRSRLVTTEFFTVDEARPAAGQNIPFADASKPLVIMVLKGAGRVTTSTGSTELAAGQTALIPASLLGPAASFAADHASTLLLATI